MKALTTAIYGKLSGSILADYVADRMYKVRARIPTEYPYLVYNVFGYPEYTFAEDYESVTVQFDLFSKEGGTTEIENMYTALTALFDNTTLSPTNERVINFQRTSFNLIDEEHTTVTGEQHVYHYSVDYEIYLERA